jgi:hypothetical protein
MTQESNEKKRTIVHVQPQDPRADAEQPIWRRLVAITQQLLTFGLWGGARAASAKVAQMEAQARKVEADAARTRARAAAIELQNAKSTMEMVKKITRSNGSPEEKLADLELLIAANPKLANSLDRLLARYESIVAQGGSITVVPGESSSLPAPARRSRRTAAGMKEKASEPPPSGIA